MDHTRLLTEMRDPENLETAFKYALHDRVEKDYFFDYFEIEFAFLNYESILTEIEEELTQPRDYVTRQSYAYFPPKNSLCYRRMVYQPLKDLIVRYAYCIVLADYLDTQLSERCFANRRASGDQMGKSLTEDFAEESWPRFCAWQEEKAEQFGVLLRTDISAFYDSVSHDYMIEILSRELGIAKNSRFLVLFRQLLEAPIVSYSHLTHEVEPATVSRQGLLIGNSTDGFLANLYLKDVDELMMSTDIEFGRYNDDMRIFANSRSEVEKAVLVLQQTLLKKGLNLNGAKTYIAEGRPEIDDLRAKDSDVYSYITSEDEDVDLAQHIDENLDKLDPVLTLDDDITDEDEAQNFCKYMSKGDEQNSASEMRKLRTKRQIDVLLDIMRRWRGSTKFAAWLLVQSGFFSDVPPEAKDTARDHLLTVLRDPAISYYGKYRILHHLVKPRMRNGSDFRFIDEFEGNNRDLLKDRLLACLGEPAFELKLTAMYALYILDEDPEVTNRLLQQHLTPPYPSPIAQAHSLIREGLPLSEARKWKDLKNGGLRLE